MGNRSISTEEFNNIVGKEVWFRTKGSSINSGKVRELKIGLSAVIDVTTMGKRPTLQHMTVEAYVTDIYLDKEELMADNREKFLELGKQSRDSRMSINGYCEDIRTVNDLVKFCHRYKDMMEAITQRSKDLLGIDIGINTYEFGK